MNLYQLRSVVLHKFGRHNKQTHYSIAPRCDWCGYRSPEQRRIAEANWRAMNGGDFA